jgi:hypothetical protein
MPLRVTRYAETTQIQHLPPAGPRHAIVAHHAILAHHANLTPA